MGQADGSRVLAIVGTRPEVIKMAPVVHELARTDRAEVLLCATSQHRDLLDQALRHFDLAADVDLDLMRPGQTPQDVTRRLLDELPPAIARLQPDWVLVQGDTTSAMASALAAHHQGVAVAHVEAGLRSGDLTSPWPEEMNRRVVGHLATLHFAPTPLARQHLLDEGVPTERIHVTGNPVIDALLWTLKGMDEDPALLGQMQQRFDFLDPQRRLILATMHRRESHGAPLARVCGALKQLSQRLDVQVVCCVHPNPAVRRVVDDVLAPCPDVHCLEPLDYLSFVHLMRQSWLIVTDSGGMQEEAPTLGKPVLVVRDTTERPEGVQAGTAQLVGTDPKRILAAATQLLDSTDAYLTVSQTHNPYGDGQAARRIASALLTSPEEIPAIAGSPHGGDA
jgi:UDP-N-acetylglucosamine 2-epimerase (non-hydrolysing)